MKTKEKSNQLYCEGGKLSPDWNGITDEETQEELIMQILNKYLHIDAPDALTSKRKAIKEIIKLFSGEEEILPQLIRAKTKRQSFKICAGCGSFAHGNPGHTLIK